MTRQELELLFEIEKGFPKDNFRPDDYYEWVEKKLIDKLNQEAEFRQFMNELQVRYE